MPPERRRLADRFARLSETAPLIVSRAGLATMGVVDMIMLARHGSADLAIAGLAEGTYGRVLDICVASLVGALTLIGAAQVRGDVAAALAVWRRGCVMALLLGAACLGIAFAAGPLLMLVGEDAALARATAPVVAIHGIGTVFALVAVASAVFLEGMRRAPQVALAVIVANLVNLAFNPLFIAGGWGLPALGAVGSALVTCAVRIGLCAMLVAMVWQNSARRGVGAFARPALSGQAAAEQWGIGALVAGIAASMHGFGIMLTVMAGWHGPLALAAYCSAWTINLPFMLFAGGYGDAATLRVARGEEGRVRRDAVRLAAMLAVPALAVSGGAIVVAQLYSSDPAMRALLLALLPMSAAVLWLDGMGVFLIAALRGQRDVFVPAAIQIGTMALTPALAAIAAFGLRLGIVGMVVAIVATSAVRFVLLALRAAPLIGILANSRTRAIRS